MIWSFWNTNLISSGAQVKYEPAMWQLPNGMFQLCHMLEVTLWILVFKEIERWWDTVVLRATLRKTHHLASCRQIEMQAFMKLIACLCMPVLLEKVPTVSHHLQKGRVWKKCQFNRSPPPVRSFCLLGSTDVWNNSAIIICKWTTNQEYIRERSIMRCVL